MDVPTLLFALGTTISVVLSLGAAGISMYALLRPQRDLDALARKVGELKRLPIEWEDYRTSLDSITKRFWRMKKLDTPQPAEDAALPVPAAAAASRAAILRGAQLRGLGLRREETGS